MTPRRFKIDPLHPDDPAAAEPCHECPFRATNEDKQRAFEVRGVNEFARLWWGLAREGRTLGCHTERRECAGSVEMIAAELRKLQKYMTWEQYHQANPLGLAEALIPRFLAKVRGRGAGTVPVSDPQRIILQLLDAEARGYILPLTTHTEPEPTT